MDTIPSNWRNPEAYDYLDGLAAPDLAWEFLRRNPDYRRDYAALTVGDDDPEAAAAFRARWGLLFPCRS